MTTPPRILAIETSGRQGSVAVASGPQLLEQRFLPVGMRHAAQLMPAVRDLVRNQGWAPRDLQQVCLSLGPGSFTGLRIAVAIARALAQATGCQLVGVPSLQVIADNAPPEFSMVLPILDAKRGQVFAARYLRDAAGSLTQSLAPALFDPRRLVEQTLTLALQISSEKTCAPIPVALLGEGIDYHRAALFSASALPATPITELDRSLWPGTAAAVHRLGFAAAQRGEFTAPSSLLPIYIRLPEAEEVYRRRHAVSVGKS